MCESIVEHGQHVGCRHDSRVVTPGSDQQPVVDLNRDKQTGQLRTLLQLLITETIRSAMYCSIASWDSSVLTENGVMMNNKKEASHII